MRYLIFLLLLILLYGCNPTVVFKEPQPEGKKDLEKFPLKYHGKYMSVEDSSIYLITAETIFEKYEEILADTESRVLEDGDLNLDGDTLIFREMNLRFPIIRRNDSVFGPIVFYDTVFNTKTNGKLRKLGKSYFLNLPSDSLWVVLKLNFSKSGAFLLDVNHENEMNTFEQYCNVEIQRDEDGNPNKYIIAPLLDEFKKLLKLETFTDTTEYIRIAE